MKLKKQPEHSKDPTSVKIPDPVPGEADKDSNVDLLDFSVTVAPGEHAIIIALGDCEEPVTIRDDMNFSDIRDLIHYPIQRAVTIARLSQIIRALREETE